jgi:hypothetical protein
MFNIQPSHGRIPEYSNMQKLKVTDTARLNKKVNKNSQFSDQLKPFGVIKKPTYHSSSGPANWRSDEARAEVGSRKGTDSLKSMPSQLESSLAE